MSVDAVSIYLQSDTREHIALMHGLAERIDGDLVVVGYGEDPDSGIALRPVIGHFPVGNIDGTVQFVMGHANEAHLNLYMAPAVYRHGLSYVSRGKKEDIVAVLGFVADFDDDNATNYIARMPLPPHYVLETSEDRFQAFLLLDKPVSPEEAEEAAKSLKSFCQCDHGTADINHVWRIPGTLNWPNKKKVDAGRGKAPQLVKVVKP